jgi:hypothetical protein
MLSAIAGKKYPDHLKLVLNELSQPQNPNANQQIRSFWTQEVSGSVPYPNNVVPAQVIRDILDIRNAVTIGLLEELGDPSNKDHKLHKTTACTKLCEQLQRKIDVLKGEIKGLEGHFYQLERRHANSQTIEQKKQLKKVLEHQKKDLQNQ